MSVSIAGYNATTSPNTLSLFKAQRGSQAAAPQTTSAYPLTDSSVLATKLSADFDAAYQRAQAEHPGIAEKNATHLAQFDVIMANRSMFPAGAFSLKTDLGDGAFIDTVIPPAVQVASQTVSVGLSFSAIAIGIQSGDENASVTPMATQLAITMATAQMSYKEWS